MEPMWKPPMFGDVGLSTWLGSGLGSFRGIRTDEVTQTLALDSLRRSQRVARLGLYQSLVDHGADVHATDDDGNRPFFGVVMNDWYGIEHMLLHAVVVSASRGLFE